MSSGIQYGGEFYGMRGSYFLGCNRHDSVWKTGKQSIYFWNLLASRDLELNRAIFFAHGARCNCNSPVMIASGYQALPTNPPNATMEQDRRDDSDATLQSLAMGESGTKRSLQERQSVKSSGRWLFLLILLQLVHDSPRRNDWNRLVSFKR